MIYVTDISSVDVQHEQFNKSFLGLLRDTYPTEQIEFWGDPAHINHIKSATESIAYRNLFVYSKRGGFKEFIRAYNQFKALSKITNLAQKNGVNSIYVLLIHPFAHFLFKLFKSKHVPVVIVMHGELESVKFNKHFLNKIWGFFQKIALTTVQKKVSYIILGESIYHNLIHVLPEFKKQQSTVLDHPYPFTKAEARPADQNTYVFSTLGVATKAKNTQYFFELAKSSFLKKLPYQFHVCGRVYKNMEPYLNEHVTFKPDFQPLTRSELDTWINQSHFTVFYYENSDYSLCASGSFWDAINAEIPLLFVRNDYFDHYSQIAGPFGLAFETPEELNNFILSSPEKNLVSTTSYLMFIENIRRLKWDYMQSANLEAQLRKASLPV